MKQFDVKDHAPSLLPDGYEFDLIWSDEFDGDTLDTSKWDYRLSMMGKRYPAWTDRGVKAENGCAVFSVFEENGEVVSSQLQTGYNFMDEPVKETTFGNDCLQWQIGKLRESKYPLLSQANCHDLDVDPEQIIVTYDNYLSGFDWMGDGFPHMDLDRFGPGIVAAFCEEAALDNSSGRVWFFPAEKKHIRDVHAVYHPDNVWAKRIKEIIKTGVEF